MLAGIVKPLGNDGRELKNAYGLKAAAVSWHSVAAQSGEGGRGGLGGNHLKLQTSPVSLTHARHKQTTKRAPYPVMFSGHTQSQ